MPTEYNEIGANILGRHSSDSIAGIPIKKRRIPLVRSPSPPPRVPSPPTGGPEQSHKGCSSSRLDSSNASGQWKVLGNTVTVQDHHQEGRGECLVGTNVNFVSDNKESFEFKHQESTCKTDQIPVNVGLSGISMPATAFCSSNLEETDSVGEIIGEGRFTVDVKAAFECGPGNANMLPVEEKPMGLPMEGQISEERTDHNSCDGVNIMVDKNLGETKSCHGAHQGPLKEPALDARGSNGKVDGNDEMVEDPYLKIHVPEEELLLPGNSLGKDDESKVDCTPRENRSHWDLNTTMETWEGTLNDSVIGPESGECHGLDADGLREKRQGHVEGCSMKMGIEEPEDNPVALEEGTIEGVLLATGSEHNFKLSKLSMTSEEHYASEASIHLQLNPSSGPSVNQDSSKEVPNLVLSVKLGSPLDDSGLSLHAEQTFPVWSCGAELPVAADMKADDGPADDEGYLPEHDFLIDENHSGVDMEVNEFVGEGETLVSVGVIHGFKESLVADDTLDISRMDVVNDKSSSGFIRFGGVSEAVSSPSVIVDSYATSEASESYEDEKINISADILEEDPYDSDYESDGSKDVSPVMEMVIKQQDNDDDSQYEDGEFREPLEHGSVDGLLEEGEAEHVDYNKEAGDCGGSGDGHVLLPLQKGVDSTKTENPDVTNDANYVGDQLSVPYSKKNDQDTSVRPCLQVTLVTEVSSSGSGKQVPIVGDSKLPQGSSHLETELESDRASSAGRDTKTKDGHSIVTDELENFEGPSSVQESHSVGSKMESSGYDPSPKGSQNGEGPVINANGRGSKSRIISLVRPAHRSIVQSSISGRVLSPPTERGKFAADASFRGNKLHAQGIRDESRRFERDRNQERPVGSFGYMHAKGRVDKEFDNSHFKWGPDRRHSSNNYNGPTGFRFNGSKNASAVAAAKIECSGFVVAPDGTIVKADHSEGGACRAMRKPLHSFHRSPPRRRRSLHDGEGGMPFGMQMGRQSLRNISPENRQVGEFGPDMIVMSHSEKFRRGLPDDMLDHSLPHPLYERANNDFARKDRSFSPIRRRNSMHSRRPFSKSPPRSRSRSPHSWGSSPPRRRSVEGFGGRLDAQHCRSPPVFRMERQRSPRQRPYFEEDMMDMVSSSRRHGSPPYISPFPEDIGEMDLPREHDRSRPFIPDRGSRGRLFQKGRRFNLMDSHERMGGDQCYKPLRPNQFHEFAGDARGLRRDDVDERRKCGERRAPPRSFRPYDGGADVEGFGYDSDDDPRPYGFCPEVGAELHRGSSSSRDFDGSVRSRFGNSLRKARNMEEQEHNYQYGGHGWHNASFNDAVPLKRRRF